MGFFFPKAEQGYVIASHQNPKDKNRGWVLDIGAREPSFRLIGNDGDNIEIRAAHTELLQPGTWNHVVVTYDGSRLQSSLDLYLNGRAIPVQHRGVAKLAGYIGVDDPLILAKSLAGGAIADFRMFGRAVSEAEAHLLSRWPAIEAALALPAAEVTDGDRGGLLDYFLFGSFEPFRRLAAEQNQLNLEARQIARRGATTLVMARTHGSEAVRLRAVPRRLRPEAPAGGGQHAERAAAHGRGAAAQSSGSGAVAVHGGSSADGAGGRQPHVAGDFRRGHRPHAPTISAARAIRPRTRNCWTGWLWISARAAGTSSASTARC